MNASLEAGLMLVKQNEDATEACFGAITKWRPRSDDRGIYGVEK